MKGQLFPLNSQYSYQEEQERPLRVPGTQCCKCPFGVSPIQSFVRVKQQNNAFSFGDVIRLLQLKKCIMCVTTRALQCVRRERGHCSLYCKGSIVVSDSQRCSLLLQDSVVLHYWTSLLITMIQISGANTGMVSISVLLLPPRNSKNLWSD